MIQKIVENRKCTGCHACFSICPSKCISMEPDAGGFLYPRVDQAKCVNCKACLKVCPIIVTNKNEENTHALGIQHYDEKVLSESSSGGAFSLLANYVLMRDGVVFGAALSDDFRQVKHVSVKEKYELVKLRGAKYVQSDIGDTYMEAYKYLKDGRLVLYSGTPCQIAGLKAYLRNDFANLVTIDLLCHGVPSPKMWRKYIEYRKREDGYKPLSISFRNKEYGWRKFAMCFNYGNSQYISTVDKDSYLQGFLRHAFLRSSCYQCEFKSIERCSDISLADFWSGKNYIQNMDDKGMSLVFTHSDKGYSLIMEVCKNVNCTEISNPHDVANGGLYNSAFYNFQRKQLMKNIDLMDFNKLEKKYFSNSLKCKIIRVLSRKYSEFFRGN